MNLSSLVGVSRSRGGHAAVGAGIVVVESSQDSWRPIFLGPRRRTLKIIPDAPVCFESYDSPGKKGKKPHG